MLETLQTNNYGFTDYSAMNDNLVYLDYIDANYTFKEITIDPSVSYRHKGDLIGLFNELGIDTNLYLYTMYINGINNPQTFDGKLTTLRLAILPPIPNR